MQYFKRYSLTSVFFTLDKFYMLYQLG